MNKQQQQKKEKGTETKNIYSVLIHWMNVSLNPSSCNVAKRKCQFTLSNAFSASNDTIIGVFCDLQIFMMLNKHCVLFDEWRRLIKPVWSGWMISEMTASRHVA